MHAEGTQEGLRAHGGVGLEGEQSRGLLLTLELMGCVFFWEGRVREGGVGAGSFPGSSGDGYVGDV